MQSQILLSLVWELILNSHVDELWESILNSDVDEFFQ